MSYTYANASSNLRKISCRRWPGWRSILSSHCVLWSVWSINGFSGQIWTCMHFKRIQNRGSTNCLPTIPTNTDGPIHANASKHLHNTSYWSLVSLQRIRGAPHHEYQQKEEKRNAGSIFVTIYINKYFKKNFNNHLNIFSKSSDCFINDCL